MLRDSIKDTITAISTPGGPGGIGIVRISGDDALKIADRIFKARDKSIPSNYRGYTVRYGWIINSSYTKTNKSSAIGHRPNNIIDEVLLTVMRAPRSYTKEDVVEIGCHSGIVVLREILDLILKNGARLADRGEFTKRAFLNGRIDLAQAEAVLDIINAKTNLALEAGLYNLQGRLSEEVSEINSEILNVLALLEADIDFPDEDIKAIDKKRLSLAINEIIRRIDSVLDSAQHGRILREGLSVVIAGRANVGKSSLLNALLKEERAIVTPIAGTTRDTIEEVIDIKGIPLKIADTAGIIEPRDLIEKEALKRTQGFLNKADLILLTFDSGYRLTEQDRLLIKKAKNRPAIAVLNKSDLKQKIEASEIKRHFPNLVKVSSLMGKGIKDLEQKIADLVWHGKVELSDEAIVTNLRHVEVLRDSRELLNRALGSFKNNLSSEFVAEDLKSARHSLGKITGDTIEEDLLNKIFSEFCIGK